MKSKDLRRKPNTYNPNTLISKIQLFEVTFLTDPKTKHLLTIIENNNSFKIEIKFSKILQFNSIKKKGYTIQGNNLPELKELVKNFLENFGMYNIKEIK